MQHKIIGFALVLYSMTTVGAIAADWVPFFKDPKTNTLWVYDREGIDYFRDKKIIFGLTTTKDKDFPKIWFKSVQDGKERRLVIEMSCNERSGRLYNDMGNVLYFDHEVDYIFDHQFWPDSVVNALYKAVCFPKQEQGKEKEKEKKDGPNF
jgi:hypothetical protein